MKVVELNEDLLDACAEFWWGIYQDRPYVHRPDGYDWTNGDPIGPHYFVNHLRAGLDAGHSAHWHGEVKQESIFVALEGAQPAGVLVSSVDAETQTGTILSAFAETTGHGRTVAEHLLQTALARFEALGLSVAVAGMPTKTIEVDSPIHLALRDAGFTWDARRWPDAGYGVFLGGSIEGFSVRPEINEKIEILRREGIEIRRCTPEEAWEHT